MRALLPRDVESNWVGLPAETRVRPSLSSRNLEKLGERLRATYEMAEPLPVRLTELVDRLGRRERRD